MGFRSGSYRCARVTPALRLSGTTNSLTPPKYSKARTWQPTHVGTSSLKTGSTYVRLLAPSTATKSFATRTSPVTASTTCTPSPLKSTKHFSPARCSWRRVTLEVASHRPYLSQKRLYW